MLGNSWMAAQLAASQEELRYIICEVTCTCKQRINTQVLIIILLIWRPLLWIELNVSEISHFSETCELMCNFVCTDDTRCDSDQSVSVGFLLNLLFYPEDGSSIYLQNVAWFHQTTRRSILDNRSLQTKIASFEASVHNRRMLPASI
jgi:hypothetical protein